MALKKIKAICIFFIFLFLISFCYSLTTLTVTEEDLVKLDISAQDPDQDEITYRYSPPLDEKGEWQTTLDDAGVYQTKVVVSDGKSQTEEEITIVVQNKNRVPEIEERQIVVVETETIDLRGLITDPDDDPLKLIFEEPFDSDGKWETSYEDAGVYQTEITVSDLDDKVTKTIEIEVIDKNRLPEVASSFSENELVELTEDATSQFSVSIRDDDEDELTYSWRLNEEEISQEPSFEHYFDFESAGEYMLALTVSDQKAELREIWILEVRDVNRAPEIEIADVIVDEGEKIILQLPEIDTDGDDITYTFKFPFEEGEWQTTYDDAGEHVITVTASDGELTAENEVKVTVNDVDRPPLINLSKKMIINEGEELKVSLEEFVVDPDGDKLAIEVGSLPKGMVFLNNALEWQPGYDFIQRKSNFFTDLLNSLRIEKFLFFRNKEVELSVMACGKELCAEHALEIQVNNINRKPLLEEIKEITIRETETILLEPSAVDPDGDYIRYEIGEPFGFCGEWGTDYDDAGEYIVTVTASDGELTDSREIKVIVLNENRLPTLEVEDSFELEENQAFSLKITADDPDQDELTLLAENLPEGASFKEQIFSWTPVVEGEEEFVVNFIASDGEFDVVHPVTFTVENVNQVPEIVSHSPVEKVKAIVDEPIIFSVTADDLDGDSLDYEWSFGFWEKSVKGPDTIQRTFKTSGVKTIKVKVSDEDSSVEKEWVVKVNSLPVVEEEVEEMVEEVVEEELEEEEEVEIVEEVEECPETVPCPEVSCPKTAPCPKPVPPQAPFKIYVVEG